MTNKSLNDGSPVASALEHNIQAIDIPPRPIIIDRIRSAMNKNVPNFRFVGQLVSADVSLAAGLIKTANSPYFSYQTRAGSVNEALMMLGLDIACRAVAMISLRQAFPNGAQYERFWDASARIAALSGWLAKQVRRPGLRPDDAYTYGLFRDCGIVVLMRRFPLYKDTLARANNEADLAFTAIEQQAFPTDHATIGYLLAQNWWLPDDICQAIRYHHDRPAIELFESGLPLISRYLVAISQLAEHLLQKVSAASHTEEWSKLGPSCLRLLGLEEADLPELYEEASLVLIDVD